MFTNHSDAPKRVIGGKDKVLFIVACALLVILVVGVLVMNSLSPVDYTMYNSGTITYEKGKVTAVLEEGLEPAPGMPGRELGNQKIIVKLTGGPMKGQEIQINNNLSTTHNIYVRKGQSVIVKADRPEGITPFYSLYNYDRTPGLCAVIVIFIASMLLAGRFKGLQSVIGLGISLFFIFAFLLPAIYRGQSPVWMSILTVIVIAAFSLLLLNGFSRKTLTAFLATASGVLLSGLFFLIISALLPLSGYNIAEAEELILISQGTGLQISQVLFAGVLVSSLGAVMDITVSVAAHMYEVKEQQSDLSARELFRSGMAVGRDMIGAMSMTLILAFVGSSLATLLSLMAYGTRFDQLMSSDYMAVEMVHGFAGSLAVILTVPVTAGLCVLFSGEMMKGEIRLTYQMKLKKTNGRKS